MRFSWIRWSAQAAKTGRYRAVERVLTQRRGYSIMLAVMTAWRVCCPALHAPWPACATELHVA